MALAVRVGSVLDDGGFPLVLGGDCSIVLGTSLALRRRGRAMTPRSCVLLSWSSGKDSAWALHLLRSSLVVE